MRQPHSPSMVTANAGVMAALSNQSKAAGCASAHSAAPVEQRDQSIGSVTTATAGRQALEQLHCAGSSRKHKLDSPSTNRGKRLTMALARRVALASRLPPGWPPLPLDAGAAPAAAAAETFSLCCCWRPELLMPLGMHGWTFRRCPGPGRARRTGRAERGESAAAAAAVRSLQQRTAGALIM